MNIDLLTKLVRLANNNPNDNEANLAARRACKLIEEGKFNFGVNTSKVNTKPPQTAYQHDWFRQYYEPSQKQKEYYQQTEPKQSQQNTGQYRCKNCGAHLEYIAIVMGGWLCDNCKQQKAREENKQYNYSKVKYEGSWGGYKSNQKSKPPAQENVTVKCLFCKQDFKRKEFRTDFICHQCYVGEKKSEEPPIIDEQTKTYYKSVFCFSCGHNFTVTYTDLTHESVGQVVGKCPQCKASYIRATK